VSSTSEQEPPRKRGPIDTAWRTYLRDVVPATAGVTQVHETRCAFYAGAMAIYSSMVAGPHPDKRHQTDAEIEGHVRAMELELLEFQRTLKMR